MVRRGLHGVLASVQGRTGSGSRTPATAAASSGLPCTCAGPRARPAPPLAAFWPSRWAFLPHPQPLSLSDVPAPT